MAGCLVCDECFGKSYTQKLFLNKVRFLVLLVMHGGPCPHSSASVAVLLLVSMSLLHRLAVVAERAHHER